MSQPTPRRSSFGNLLRRSKSGDLRGGRKASQGQPRELVPNSPPRLPALYNGSQPQPLETFGGDTRPNSVAIVSGKADHSFHHYPPRASIDPGRPSMSPSVARPPVPPVPNGAWVDPYARTESMTNRGRYSYASSAVSTVNSPRRVRRRKDPTPFKYAVSPPTFYARWPC